MTEKAPPQSRNTDKQTFSSKPQQLHQAVDFAGMQGVVENIELASAEQMM